MYRLLIVIGLALASGSATGQKLKEVKADDPDNSPRESVRQAIFRGSLDTPSCIAVEAKALVNYDAELDGFINLLIRSIKDQKPKRMLALFHKRLNIGLPVVEKLFTDMNNTYRPPFDISVYRAFALNTVTGKPDGLTCDSDRLTAFPLYGYPLQFGIWLQVMGQNELGRIYVTMVPTKDRWNIGSFHIQQWTHDSKDFATWTEEAVKNGRMGLKEAAWAKYDIAAKLLSGGGFLEIAMQKDIEAARDALMTKKEWDAAIAAPIKNEKVVFVNSMLVNGGAGILVRVSIPKEISAVEVTNRCFEMAKSMIQQPWHAHLAGVRCGFNFTGEDPAKDGALGGVYIDFETVRKKVATSKGDE